MRILRPPCRLSTGFRSFSELLSRVIMGTEPGWPRPNSLQRQTESGFENGTLLCSAATVVVVLLDRVKGSSLRIFLTRLVLHRGGFAIIFPVIVRGRSSVGRASRSQ